VWAVRGEGLKHSLSARTVKGILTVHFTDSAALVVVVLCRHGHAGHPKLGAGPEFFAKTNLIK
jgi:hypothetical protein